MLYAVSAKLIPDRAPEFHTRLTDGSIAAQRPDGAEIVAAMKRARAAPDDTVRWTETCYCPMPLQHERATVFDRYFTEIETKVIDKPETFYGVPLMDRLAGARSVAPGWSMILSKGHPTTRGAATAPRAAAEMATGRICDRFNATLASSVQPSPLWPLDLDGVLDRVSRAAARRGDLGRRALADHRHRGRAVRRGQALQYRAPHG
jgi:hypothetical protein